MTIDLTVSRPKLDTTNNVSVSIIPDTATLDGSKILLKVLLDNLSPNSVSFSCTFVEAENTITFTNNTGKPISSLIRRGDVVSGGSSPFSGTAYVTNIEAVGNAITLTISEDATTSGTATLTFAAGTIDSTLYILELDHAASGSNILIRPALYTFDGTKVEDANRDGDDDLTIADASSKANLAVQSINVDSYLNNARLLRTNA